MTHEETAQIEKLLDFVRYYATCPCCGKDDVCTDDCTFEMDDPQSFDLMKEAREALQ